jgi:hypothetical protein
MPTLSPLAQAAVGSIARWLFMLGGAYLVKYGIWSLTAAESYATAFAIWAVVEGWSLINKYMTDHKITVALQMPPDSTKADLNKEIKEGA